MPEQVYVDQIASYYAEPCSDGGGAHRNITGGGGSSWADGNRATLKKAVEAVGPGRVLISESNAEAYLGSLHAVSGPLRPFWRAVLTEIYLCASCSCHEILRSATARVSTSRSTASGSVTSCRRFRRCTGAGPSTWVRLGGHPRSMACASCWRTVCASQVL
jgi:hypothetical protein